MGSSFACVKKAGVQARPETEMDCRHIPAPTSKRGCKEPPRLHEKGSWGPNCSKTAAGGGYTNSQDQTPGNRPAPSRREVIFVAPSNSSPLAAQSRLLWIIGVVRRHLKGKREAADSLGALFPRVPTAAGVKNHIFTSERGEVSYVSSSYRLHTVPCCHSQRIIGRH